MSTHPISHRRPKSLAEGAVCFSCTAGILFAAALATQWLLSLLP
jgi:hypothetical protein